MATVDVTRLRELRAAATAGEWWATRLNRDYGVFVGVAGVVITTNETENAESNAAYIAAVHNALPAVLDALEQARAERDALAAELDSVRAQAERRVEQAGFATAAQQNDRDAIMRENVRLVEQLHAVVAERDTLRAQLATVQPSDYENSQAEERIRQIDRLFATYGMNRDVWPQHAQDVFTRLDTAQRAYEAKYC